MITRVPPMIHWVLAALAIASLWAAARPVVQRISTVGTVSPGIVMPVPQTQQVDLTAILDFAAFGRSVDGSGGVVAPGEEAPGLTLLGVAVAADPALSRAIIAGGDAPGRGYAVGAAVAPGIVLAGIRATHVVLSVNGQQQSLFFPKSGELAATDNITDAAAGTVDLAHLIPMVQEPDAAAAPALPDDPVALMRDELHQDGMGLLRRLGLEPAEGGYRIGENPAPVLQQAGLVPGDLVTRVNGQQVGNLDQDQRYFDTVVASGQARLDILRGGAAITLTFPLP